MIRDHCREQKAAASLGYAFTNQEKIVTLGWKSFLFRRQLAACVAGAGCSLGWLWWVADEYGIHWQRLGCVVAGVFVVVDINARLIAARQDGGDSPRRKEGRSELML